MSSRITESGAGELRSLNYMLCFELHAASRAMTAVYRPLLDELGLTYTQYLVMVLLWEREPRLVKEIGRALDLDSGTLSPLLKRLAAAGLVHRSRRAEDEREVEVTLTDEGRDLRERARDVPQAVEGATGLSAEEISALRKQLTGLRTSLRETLDGHPA